MRSIHAIEVQDKSNLASDDRLKLCLQMAVANLVGAGAGAAVTVAVTFAEAMPANYHVTPDCGQDVVAYATAKTVNGFTLNILPRLAANTVAAGTVNLLIVA